MLIFSDAVLSLSELILRQLIDRRYSRHDDKSTNPLAARIWQLL